MPKSAVDLQMLGSAWNLTCHQPFCSPKSHLPQLYSKEVLHCRTAARRRILSTRIFWSRKWLADMSVGRPSGTALEKSWTRRWRSLSRNTPHRCPGVSASAHRPLGIADSMSSLWKWKAPRSDRLVKQVAGHREFADKCRKCREWTFPSSLRDLSAKGCTARESDRRGPSLTDKSPRTLQVVRPWNKLTLDRSSLLNPGFQSLKSSSSPRYQPSCVSFAGTYLKRGIRSFKPYRLNESLMYSTSTYA